MASPKMVDMRQLNPQQLTEVAQRIDTELQVLQNCQNELLSGKSLRILGVLKLILPHLNNTLCIDSFTSSGLPSNQHRLIFSLAQHVIVSIITNGEDVRRHFRFSLSFVAADHMVIVNRQPLQTKMLFCRIKLIKTLFF